MSEDGFIGRWSRLKRTGADAPQPETEPEAESISPQAEAPDEGCAEVLAEGEITAEEIAALPPVETITAQTDLTAFLRRGVPPLLRQAALRRMWRVNPAIRDYVDDAREYAFDWNAPNGVPGGGAVPSDAASKLLGRMFRPLAEASSETLAPDAGLVEEQAPNYVSRDTPQTEAPAEPAAERREAEGDTGEVPRRRHGGATPA